MQGILVPGTFCSFSRSNLGRGPVGGLAVAFVARYTHGPLRPDGRVAMQRTANPCTSVRFRLGPPYPRWDCKSPDESSHSRDRLTGLPVSDCSSDGFSGFRPTAVGLSHFVGPRVTLDFSTAQRRFG